MKSKDFDPELLGFELYHAHPISYQIKFDKVTIHIELIEGSWLNNKHIYRIDVYGVPFLMSENNTTLVYYGNIPTHNFGKEILKNIYNSVFDKEQLRKLKISKLIQ